MTYKYRKTGFASALALGVAMIGLAGAASASSIHVLTSEGQVLLADTANGTASLVNTISPLEGPDTDFSPNSLGFFDGTFYATTFMSSGGDETIYRFAANTTENEFAAGTVSSDGENAFAAGDANADGFSVVDGAGTFTPINFNPVEKGSTSDFTDNSSTFGDIAFDTFNPGVTFASYNSVLEKFENGTSVDSKPFTRYVGLAFDEWGQLFGVSSGGGIFTLNFDDSSDEGTLKSTINFEGSNVTLTDAASVTPVPLPAAGWLMLVGFGGLSALRRRKRTA